MVKKILTYPHPALMQPSVRVVDFFGIKQLILDLRQTMLKTKGAGLAANQIGDNRAVFVLDNSVGRLMSPNRTIFINPEIAEQSDVLITEEEACLSIPGVVLRVPRPEWVRIRAYDINGHEFAASGRGFAARVLLHEYDHLDGKLFTRLSNP